MDNDRVKRIDQAMTDWREDVKTHYIDVPVQPRPKPSGECANCHKRPATQFWTGEGGSLAFSHGMYQSWCLPCVLRAQLEYAKERAEAIPELERELAELDTVEGVNSPTHTDTKGPGTLTSASAP
jgi:hypothetical protein